MQIFKTIHLFTLGLIAFFIVGCNDFSTIKVTQLKGLALSTGVINHAPALDNISNQAVKASRSIVTINAGENGADKDVDGEALTYSCFYDSIVDGAVAEVSTCSSLSGLSFNTSTGVMDWATTVSDAGVFEFKIIATDGVLSDFKVFTITVNANIPPVLDTIADQTTSEGIAITAVNAGVAGADVDSEGETLTYTCHYDTTVDGNVAATNLCSSLTGASFNTTSGVLNWLPNFTQSGNYEFKISASDGFDVGEQIFEITVNNVNQAPVLDAIANQTVNEGVAITSVNAGDGGDDFDRDGDFITYACYYDTTVDGIVATTNSCLSLIGVSFDVGTGVLDWTPSMSQSGNYEFRIEGSDGSLSGDKIFTITVNNVNSAPILDAIANQTVDELTAIATIDAGDGGDDFDVDNDALTYSCFYDNTVDGVVASTSACTGLTGLSFDTSAGTMNWTPSLTQSGIYEFKIVGSDGSLEASRVFTITVNNITPFIFKWRTTTASEVMELPIASGGTYNYTVDWGDGTAPQTITTFADTRKNHTYAAAGTYTVMIKGVLSAISFLNLPSRTKVLEVVDLGNTQAVNLSYAFAGCTNLVSFSGGDTSKVTDMNTMFLSASSLVNIDLSTFDTSKVTNMGAMFQGANKITSLDLSNFNTSNVTNLRYMFYGASALTSLNVSSFNTAKVTNMNGTFAFLSSLTTLDVSHFQTALVTDMGWMFYEVSKVAELDVRGFDTSKVTRMDYMFRGCSSLTSLDLSSFRTSLVTDMNTMFSGVSKITTLDVSTFNTSNVTRMNSMFSYMGELTSLDLSNFDTSKVTDMNYMFKYSSKITALNISSFNTSNVTDMSSMFSNLPLLTSLNLSHFNTSKVKDMQYMFYSMTALTSLNLTSFDTSVVTTMSGMFGYSPALTVLDLSSFNTSNVTDMSYMFTQAKNVVVDFSNFNTSKVTTMNAMFMATNATSLDLSSFDTSKVTNMQSMFFAANSLTSLNATGWNVAGVTNSTGIFNGVPVGFKATCDQGGSPGTGTLFGKTCY